MNQMVEMNKEVLYKRSLVDLWAPLIVMAFAIGCKGGAKDKAIKDIAEATDQFNKSNGQVSTIPSEPNLQNLDKADLRAGYVQEHSYIQSLSRAELRQGGLFIDFGTGDHVKYIRGGWQSGWELKKEKNQDRVTALSFTSEAILNTYFQESPSKVVINVDCHKKDHEITIKNSSQTISRRCEKTGWNQIVFGPLTSKLKGRERWTIRHDAKKSLWVDWIWFAKDVVKAPVLPLSWSGPLSLQNGVRRSILSPNSQSFTFYLVPKAARSLVFDYGSKKEAKFAIYVVKTDGTEKEVFSANATDGSWKSAKVDLTEFENTPIALRFETLGEASGAGWGEPGIYRNKKDENKVQKNLRAKNLIMIVLDTTRADSFVAFNPNNKIKTPIFDAFQKRSLTFTSAYNNGNWTKPSVTSLLSGLTAMTHGATKPDSEVPPKAKLLSEYLKENRFDTVAFSANPVVGPAHGFDKGWDSLTVYEKSEGDGHAMYHRAADWITNRKDDPDRFFMFIQTIDAHTTYAPPRSYSKPYHDDNYQGVIGTGFTREEQRDINDRKIKIGDKDKVWIQALYKGEVTYQDEKLGVLLKAIEDGGYLEDTIVVVTNDHGEELFDHGTIGHGWQLYEEMIRAPLLMHFPPLVDAGTYAKAVEHSDVSPTVMDMLGLDPMRRIDGLSLYDEITQQNDGEALTHYAVSISDNGKRSVVAPPYKLIVHKSKGWIGLYNIQSKAAESKDITRNEAMVGRMLEILLAEAMFNPMKSSRLSGSAGQKLATPTMHLDPKTKAQLEALGYL